MTKFYIDQHGCAKNQVDGEILISKLIDDGYEYVETADDADVIIINSCGFIESAKKESLNALYDARAAYPKKKIILAGCLAERYAEIFKENLPEADGIFGNGDLLTISEFFKTVSSKKANSKKTVQVSEQQGVCCYNRKHFMNFKNSAYVKITEGCSNHCSFCAIPIIRGELRSRPLKDVVSEIKLLLKQGFFEINLIGQDLAAYGTGVADKELFKNKDGTSQLSLLLTEISKLKGNFWIRLLYIHPDHFNSDILECIKNDNRILAYFDIPFQSGDTEIIHSMNRTGSKESYISLVKKIRKELPDCALRTTLMTGFPGETDEAFNNSKEFLQAITPDWSGCFDYSREEDTPAYRFKNKVSKKVAKDRALILEAAQEKITASRLKKRINKIYDVLIEEVLDQTSQDDDNDAAFAIGRAWFQAPDVDGAIVVRYEKDDKAAVKAIKPGRLVQVKADRVSGVDIDSYFIKDSELNKKK